MPDDVQKLIKALEDTNSLVRERAAFALGQIGDARAVEPLCKVPGHTDSGVRQNATAALVKIGAPAVEPLRKALGHTDSGVRRNAAQALGKIGNQDVLPRKILLCSAMDVRRRVLALNMLSADGKYYRDDRFHRYKTPDARQFCREMVGNDDAEVRKAAEEMRLYLENERLVPTQRDEPADKVQLLRGASVEQGSESRAELLRGSEAASSPVSGKSSFLARFRWPRVRNSTKADGTDI